MLADEDDSSLKERVEYEAKQLKLWDQFKQTERVHDSTTTTIEALVKRLVVAKESANSVSPDRNHCCSKKLKSLPAAFVIVFESESVTLIM